MELIALPVMAQEIYRLGEEHKLKILMIAPQPFFQPRGTPLSVYYRIKALTELGHEVDLLTYHIGEDTDIYGCKIHRIIALPFIRHVKIGPSFAKIPLDIFLTVKAIAMLLKKRYDCIHTHEEAGIIGSFLRKVFKIRHIYDMHSSLPEQFENYNFTRSRMIIGLVRFFERWVVRNSDAVIVICQHLMDIVNSIRKDSKVILIENQPLTLSLTAENLKPLRPQILESLHPSTRILLYTGTFEANQGIDLLLASIPFVLKAINNLKFVLVGGEQWQIEDMRRLARDLGVNDHIIFTGKKPPSEMPLHIAIADVLLSPRTRGTNTPLKIYSYLRSGKPIVATNLYTHTQVLTDEIAVLTEPDPVAYAEGIIRLLQNKELAKKLGERGKAFAEKNYSYAKFLSKTRDVYAWIQESL